MSGANSPWYDDDTFWQTFGPVMFPPKCWEGTPGEVDRLVALAGLRPGTAVLDLCCGPGRYSLEFARRGFTVTGVDRTAAYLAEARTRAEADRLNIDFIQEDMRRFCRFQEFDTVISMFTSFGYFEDEQDDRQVLANVFCSLKPGGVLVMDLIGKEILARVYQARDWSEDDGRFVLYERKPINNWSRMENRWIVFVDGRKHEYRLDHRVFCASELTELLTVCGFEEVRAFGDLSGAPYDHQAKRLVAVARKPGGQYGGET
jgi:SAM-dependent methyltransferase